MAGKQYGMASRGKSASNSRGSRTSHPDVKTGNFVDRNLMNVSPLKEQFEPTSATPVRARYKMGGGC